MNFIRFKNFDLVKDKFIGLNTDNCARFIFQDNIVIDILPKDSFYFYKYRNTIDIYVKSYNHTHAYTLRADDIWKQFYKDFLLMFKDRFYIECRKEVSIVIDNLVDETLEKFDSFFKLKMKQSNDSGFRKGFVNENIFHL